MRKSEKIFIWISYFVLVLTICYVLIRYNEEPKSKPPETIIVERDISPIPYKELGEFEITFYSPKELGAKNRFELKTSTGKIPKQSRTVAVDPKIIPYGSIIYIKGQGYFIAEDCGSAVKNKRLDIFVNDYKLAIKNGRIKADVFLLTSNN